MYSGEAEAFPTWVFAYPDKLTILDLDSQQQGELETEVDLEVQGRATLT